MNEHLMEILARQIVTSLPEQKRQVYDFIVNLEDSLASQSQTSDQFMSLLVKHAPHRQAAKHFQTTSETIMGMMREIEIEIDHRLKEQLQTVQWIDRTDETLSKSGKTETISHFLFLMKPIQSKL